MATIKVKYRASTKAEKEGRIYYQVIHDRMIRLINTDYKVFSNEWDEVLCAVEFSSCSVERERYLKRVANSIKRDEKHLNKLICNFNRKGSLYSIDDIVNAFKSGSNSDSFLDFMKAVIVRLKDLNKIRTSKSYQSTLNSFAEFLGGEDISLDMLDIYLLEEYEAFLKIKGNVHNTITFHMRNLRAIYNRAVDRELIEQKFPFKHVQINIEKTTKRAIPLKDISQIKELDLFHLKELEFARDIFLFSFYTRGMSFIDISYLRKKDIQNGILSYRRRKTGQRLEMRWEKCMDDIVKKYASTNKESEYLLPIIIDKYKCSNQQYSVVSAKINRHLKKIAEILHLQINLTMYVARHSWASAAKYKNIPLSVISEGMGHNNETTTQIYLSQLDTKVIDRANRMIINSL